MNTFHEWTGSEQARWLFSPSTPLPLELLEAATLFSYLIMRDAEDRDVPDTE